MGISTGTSMLISSAIGGGASIAGAAINASAAGNVKSSKIPPPNPLFPGAQSNYLQQLGVTGSSGLGPTSLSSLNTLAQTGSPTDVGPAWQALVDSQKTVAAQGQANIAEQFAGSGLAYSSDLMKSLSSYQSQLGANYGSILANYTMNAQESAANRQLSAATVGAGMFADVGTAMTPSNVQTVGGSALGAGLSSGGNALQMLAFMKMLYPGTNTTGGTPTMGQPSTAGTVTNSSGVGDFGSTLPAWATINPVVNVPFGVNG